MDPVIQNVMQAGSAQALIVVSAADLRDFAANLISSTRRIVEAEYKDQYCSVDELAHLLCVTKPTVYAMARDGRLQPIKVGRRTVFSRSAVRDAIAAGVLGNRYVRR